jgi:PD-(D/E)XK nuclease superfamily
MAAGHPKLKSHPGVDLFLSRFADSEWRGIIRPWLEAASGRLERSIIVAPTRGQTHALKQRCIAEGLPLLGVEFLTPGLARKKRVLKPELGRSLQVLVLRTLIEARLSPLDDEDPARRFWKSLESDVENALDDFEELLRGGFGSADFPSAELREVFGEFESWIARNGYALAAKQDEDAGLAVVSPDLPRVAERLLMLAGGPEGWGEFFGLAALVRRCGSVTVVLAEPEFRGKGSTGEEWVSIWETFLGVNSVTVDSAEPDEGCAGVAELWTGSSGSAERARVILGGTRSDEMEKVASAVDGLLSDGADNVAVIFPSGGSANAELARLLADREIAFADLVGTSGTPPVDTVIQRSLVDFYARGCRLEELLALWPLLRSLGLAKITLSQARQASQRLFDEVQAHAIEPHLDQLGAIKGAGAGEVARVAKLLLPGWPKNLPAAEALSRFEAVRDRLGLSEPAGWSVLREFSRRVTEPMPSSALLEAIRDFLPEKGPAKNAPGKGVFARVTLTTGMRAAGLAWSDVILVAANEGIWPERREPSCWIGDEARRTLNLRGRFSLGLPTGDDRAALVRRMLSSIARDTRSSITLSAALYSEVRPEEGLGPNAWLERILWKKGLMSASGSRLGPFGVLSLGVSKSAQVQGGAGAGWLAIWNRRRDPGARFDEFFLGDPVAKVRPARLSAGEIEAGIRDPACLWFDAVLRVKRVGWGPFPRAPRKSMGTWVHRVLASAMRGTPVSGEFFQFPDRASSETRLASELEALRARWPDDRYWDSFHGDVARAARELLARVYQLPTLRFAAVEVDVPEGATIPAGDAGQVPVHGRMDLVLCDSGQWRGSNIEIVDFKTGAGPLLSARRMNSTGASLQLGVYLHAVLSLGAKAGVWMLKPEEQPRRIGEEALERASAKLGILGSHLVSGLYGARTPDRGEFVRGFEWPLACAPIAASILEAKFEATFGAAPVGAAEDSND